MSPNSAAVNLILVFCVFLFTYPLSTKSQVMAPNGPMCCFKHGVTAKVSDDCKTDLMDLMEKSATDWPSHREERANWIAWDCSDGYAQCCLVNEKIDTWIVKDAADCDNKLNPEITLACGNAAGGQEAMTNNKDNEQQTQPQEPAGENRRGWNWWWGSRKLRAATSFYYY